MSDLSKEQRILDEISRLKQVFSNLDENTQGTIEAMITKAAFMSVTIDDLQEIINENGIKEEYQNGATQHGYKKSAEVEVHLSMTKNYTSIMKQLNDLLPKDIAKVPNDPLLDFINEPK